MSMVVGREGGALCNCYGAIKTAGTIAAVSNVLHLEAVLVVILAMCVCFCFDPISNCLVWTEAEAKIPAPW